MARKVPPTKPTRKQIAAIKRHLLRTRGKLPAVRSCTAIGGKKIGHIYHGVVVVCRRGPNRWELL